MSHDKFRLHNQYNEAIENRKKMKLTYTPMEVNDDVQRYFRRMTPAPMNIYAITDPTHRTNHAFNSTTIDNVCKSHGSAFE